MRAITLWLLFSALPCFAQVELGAAIGYGFYRGAQIFSPDGKAIAGILNRFSVSATMTEDPYEYLSGEIRYMYHDGDPYIKGRGTDTRLQGQSHAADYDLMFNFRKRDRKVRPYVTAGVGAKVYLVRGPPNPNQPLSDIATLTTKDDPRFMAVFGVGVRIRLQSHASFRADFLDPMTTFPRTEIQPVPLATGRGIFQTFTPLVGFNYVF